MSRPVRITSAYLQIYHIPASRKHRDQSSPSVSFFLSFQSIFDHHHCDLASGTDLLAHDIAKMRFLRPMRVANVACYLLIHCTLDFLLTGLLLLCHLYFVAQNTITCSRYVLQVCCIFSNILVFDVLCFSLATLASVTMATYECIECIRELELTSKVLEHFVDTCETVLRC